MISILLMILALISCAGTMYLSRPARRDTVPIGFWYAMVAVNLVLFAANLGWLFLGTD